MSQPRPAHVSKTVGSVDAQKATPKKVANTSKTVMPDKSPKKKKAKVNHKGDGDGTSKSSSQKSKSKKGGIFASKGVQMLLEAEQKYKRHVEAAKQRRKAFLKQAKLEASDELDELRNEMEKMYQAKLDEVAMEEKRMAIEIAEKTEIALGEMAESVKNNKSKALDILEQEFMDIKPVPHTNFTFRKQVEGVTAIKE